MKKLIAALSCASFIVPIIAEARGGHYDGGQRNLTCVRARATIHFLFNSRKPFTGAFCFF